MERKSGADARTRSVWRTVPNSWMAGTRWGVRPAPVREVSAIPETKARDASGWQVANQVYPHEAMHQRSEVDRS